MKVYQCPHCDNWTAYSLTRIPGEGLSLRCSQCKMFFMVFRKTPFRNTAIGRHNEVMRQEQPAMIPCMT